MKPLVLLALLLTSFTLYSEEAKVKAEDIVSKNLASVGTPEARAKLQGLQITGKSTLGASNGGVTGDGTGMLASQGNKMRFETKYNNPRYTGDTVVFDGKNVLVSKDSAGNRSMFGELIVMQPGIFSYGLFGGVDTTSWLLNDPKLRGGKLNYSGVKKIDGVNAHELVYQPEQSDKNFRAKLYFNTENFRHIKTVYTVFVPSEMQAGAKSRMKGMGQLSSTPNATFTIEETFSDFRQLGPYMLPMGHKVTYTSDTGKTGIWTFDNSYNEINGSKIPPEKK